VLCSYRECANFTLFFILGGDRGGFRGGFGDRGRGGRGRGRGRGRGGRGGGRGKEDKEWIPVTKLGRLVKDGKIKSLEEIYLYSLPIKVFCLMSQSLKIHDPYFSYR